jgi:hypothetical protein
VLFEKYCQWLYSSRVPQPPSGVSGVGPYKEWASLYVLGNKIMDGKFQDEIIGAIIDYAMIKGTKFPANPVIKIVYGGTTKNSLLRRLMVDFCAYNARADWCGVDNLMEETFLEFIQELIPALLKTRSGPVHAELVSH